MLLLMLLQDDLCLKLSAAGDGTYQLLGTLKYGTTLAAGVRPAPKQQPTSAAAAASTAEADPPAEAPEAGEGAAAAAAAEGEAERAEPAAEEAGAAAAAGVTPGCVPSPGYIQVVTPDGVLVEVSTSGVVLMAPLNQEHLTVGVVDWDVRHAADCTSTTSLVLDSSCQQHVALHSWNGCTCQLRKAALSLLAGPATRGIICLVRFAADCAAGARCTGCADPGGPHTPWPPGCPPARGLL
jgi:hypothetical protein